MTQSHQFSVRFPCPLRGVVRAEKSHPLPPQPAPPAPLAQPTPQPSPEALAELERTAFQNILAGLRKAAAQVATQHESMLSEMRQAAVELAIAVAGRLLHDKVHAGEYPLEKVIRQVVDKLPVRRKVIVSMHPDDLALLRQRLGEKALESESPVLEFRADTRLTRGACKAEAGGVTVLSDLQEQLALLRQELLEGVAHAQAQPR